MLTDIFYIFFCRHPVSSLSSELYMTTTLPLIATLYTVVLGTPPPLPTILTPATTSVVRLMFPPQG